MDTAVRHAGSRQRETHFMWLEITGNCQLECSHCYAGSGPGRGHGVVSVEQWAQTLTEAAAAGVRQVQFIGGEPTAHPALPLLIAHALGEGLAVEVFSNLFSIRERVWEVLAQPCVSLATSYYSPSAGVHDQITGRGGSHGRTKANIGEAVRRGIPIRVGLTRLTEDQDIEAAISELVAIGVDRGAIGVDDLRGVGRGRDSAACTTENELCGNCAGGVLAFMPDGTVQPCVFSRDARFEVGNITIDPLTSVLAGDRLHRIREDLTSVFLERGIIGADCPPAEPTHRHHCGPAGGGGPCAPASNPSPCIPAGVATLEVHNCGPSCSPACSPTGSCNPIVNPPPCNPQAGHPPRPEPTPRPPGPVCGPY